MSVSQHRHLNGELRFSVGARMRFIGKEMSINRFQRIEASWGYCGTPDRIKFVFIFSYSGYKKNQKIFWLGKELKFKTKSGTFF